MNAVRTTLLIAATLATGLAAGVFALYSHTLMPGLATVDDRTFVATFQAIDRAIINPWFIGATFFGSLVLAVAAAVTHLGRPALLWIVAAAVLSLGVVVITIAVNVPLNDALKAAGDPHRIADPATVRQQFHEARWAAWNLARTVTSTAAFACLCWALVLHGRSLT